MRAVDVKLALILTVGCAGISARGDLLLYEPFDYGLGSSLVAQSNIYISPNQTWNLTGTTNGSLGPTIVQGDATDNLDSLSVPGLAPSIGYAVTPRSGDTKDTASPRIAFADGTVIAKNTADPSQTAGTTVYYSLMLRVDTSSSDVGNTGTVGVGGSGTADNQGIFIAGFNNNTTTQTPPLTGVAAALTMHQNPINSDTFSLGLTNNVNGTANNAQLRTFDDDIMLGKGSTIFIVAGYTFGNGNVTTDSANLWINPAIGTFSQLAPVTPPDFTVTTNFTGINPYQIASFFLRDNSFDPSLMTIDEVRVGTTWADVTPRDPSIHPGDANLDHVIDSADFDALKNGFAQHLTGWANGDFNGDGVINADDFAVFSENYALYGTASAQTPEPCAAGMLMSLGAAPLAVRRRKVSRV